MGRPSRRRADKHNDLLMRSRGDLVKAHSSIAINVPIFCHVFQTVGMAKAHFTPRIDQQACSYWEDQQKKKKEKEKTATFIHFSWNKMQTVKLKNKKSGGEQRGERMPALQLILQSGSSIIFAPFGSHWKRCFLIIDCAMFGISTIYMDILILAVTM